jgi:hypothetical protein
VVKGYWKVVTVGKNNWGVCWQSGGTEMFHLGGKKEEKKEVAAIF